MRVLALETTGMAGSVAALDGERLLASRDLSQGQRSARSLAPAIAQLWSDVAWKAKDVELIAVTVGPGSFTGLRVGVATAKTLAYATGAQVAAVDAHVVVAEQAPPEAARCYSAFDAQRGEWSVAEFVRDSAKGGLPCAVAAASIVDAEDWLHRLPSNATLSGPALIHWKDSFPAGVRIADASRWQPQAETVGRIGLRAWQAGQRIDLWSLAPRYVRASAAEEKLSRG